METIISLLALVISIIFLYYYHLHEAVVKAVERVIKDDPSNYFSRLISPRDKVPMISLSIAGGVLILIVFSPNYFDVMFAIFFFAVCGGTSFCPNFLATHYRRRINTRLSERLAHFIVDQNFEMEALIRSIILDLKSNKSNNELKLD